MMLWLHGDRFRSGRSRFACDETSSRFGGMRSSLIQPEKGDADQLTELGETNYRDPRQVFGLKPDDRRRHLFVVGKTGMGKSTLLRNMLVSDIRQGRGVGLIDPHGDLSQQVLQSIPRHRTNDVVYCDEMPAIGNFRSPSIRWPVTGPSSGRWWRPKRSPSVANVQ